MHPNTDIPDDDALERDEGVFVRRGGGRDVGCDDSQDSCAPDDTLEDPVNDEHVPGTVDDLPYDYGVEVPIATDEQLLSFDTGPMAGFGDVGLTEADEADLGDEESPLGAADERELWHHQRGLIDEASDEARRYRGIDDAHVRDLEAAVGEDAGEVMPESPEGTSATGSVSEQE